MWSHPAACSLFFCVCGVGEGCGGILVGDDVVLPSDVRLVFPVPTFAVWVLCGLGG